MTKKGKSGALITLQELAVSNAYEIAALVSVLERKGIPTQQDYFDRRDTARLQQRLIARLAALGLRVTLEPMPEAA